jgi:leucyl aminopeptidase
MRAITLAAATALTAGPALAQALEITAPGQVLPAEGAIALPVSTGGVLGTGGASLAPSVREEIARAIRVADWKGAKDTTLTLHAVDRYDRIVLIGVGDGLSGKAELRNWGGRLAVAAAAGAPATLVAALPDAPDVTDDAAQIAIGYRLRAYAWGKVGKRATPDPKRLVRLLATRITDPAPAMADAEAVSGGVALARDLISTPSNIKTPQFFVEETRKAFAGLPVDITVLDEAQMARMGMGGMLGVGQGSTRPPRLLAVSYKGAGDAAPIACVGKGITFDTGGISIKPGDGMWRMRYDMSGAAACMGAVLAQARRGAKVNMVGVAALAENMPDGNAIRPGDVLTSYSGKTMEILNTDAEGRIVLADAVWWAQEVYKPRAVVTIATLTGAVRTALGDDYAGLLGNDDALAAAVTAAGQRAGEPVWRLPIHESVYKEIRDSAVADVRNVVEGGAPGASIGAAFIGEWIKPGQPWAHLDIAGMAWRTSATATVPEGAVGFGVQLMDELARELK